VRCGGGRCHRLGLHDAVLLKDNHLASAGALAGKPLAEAVRAAVKMARDEAPKDGLRFIELEVDTLEQLGTILEAGGCGVGIVLLDNMGPDLLRRAVEMRDGSGLKVLLEASGGVSLETIGAIAATGVDRISAGAITHGATWVDVGLDR
jgi:nicotinate-nucleotide pyrophosphorylase (carboxylating)